MLVGASGKKRAEDARAYLAAIIASSTDAIISKTLDGIVTSWNGGAEAIFGHTADEMIGRPIAILFPPDRLAEEDQILARLRRGERVEHFETVRRRKDGRDIDVSVTISPVRDGCGRIIGASKIARDISARKHAEAMLRGLNENLERRVAERAYELAEANRRLMAEMAERDRSEAALRQVQKLEVVGQLASGLAHDFNNLLAAILGNLELLEMRLTDERLRRLVRAAARAARRGAKLNERMLAFSRKQHLAPKPVELNELIRGIRDLLHHTLGGAVEVATALAPDLWPVRVDPHLLEMVVLNLAINGRDAMALGGRLVIETRNVKAGDLDASIGLVPDDYVLVSVADTGTGMTPDVLAHACEPFFTTKEPGRGSGLGLAQVVGFAKQSGGGLGIRSTPGEGTTVGVYLPRSPDPASALREDPGRASRCRAIPGARVLVVDDQEDVREVIAAYLDELGYSVAQAAGGPPALEFLQTNSDGVDLLIADYAMPAMSGIELARAARERRPNLPVIVVTGRSDPAGIEAETENAILLLKPFRMHQLGAAIEHALRRKGSVPTSSRIVRLKPRPRR
jgi:PAS domain S-box-containing protein